MSNNSSKIELVSDFKPRLYQESIFAKSIDKNSLVVLPTGFGKTIIAVMLAVYYFNKTGKKILFLAPTKPLVEQQKKSFEGFFKNSSEFNYQVLTGLIGPSKRQSLYEESDFVFSTPQLIENDLINRVINPKDFCFVVFDEAHRATGDYSYTFIAKEFNKVNSKFLGLSASPGTSKQEIYGIISNLKIENLDVRTYEDSDIQEYINKTQIQKIEVEIPKEFKDIRDLLYLSLDKRLKKLQELGMLRGSSTQNLMKRDLLSLQSELRMKASSGDANEDVWNAISLSAAVMKLQYGIELFESQEISSAHTYFHNILRPGGDDSKAAKELAIDNNFRDAYDSISKLKEQSVLHPKLIKLKELVLKKINENKDLRIIVFSSYRDSAQKIVMELNTIKEIKSSIFLGQAKKGEVKMSQKEQKEVLEKFREGEFNVLVSTSVGEEGLDIPKVDCVIFYEPVASAIRTIQRIGRTGRFKKGEAYILQTKGTRDIIVSHIANAKEKKMNRVLGEIRKELNGEDKEGGLGKYLKKGEEESEEESQIESGIVKDEEIRSGIEIYVDQRENTSLIKELYELDELNIVSKQLDVGDIVIDDEIAIERKAKIDFVNSIIDKRLFEQLINLARNYRRPILILEGEENLYSLRNLNPNVIRATLSAIAVDMRIPIIYTSDIKETAQMILTIAKRTKKEKKEISLATDKKAHSENEELEKVVSNIPRINVVSAKALLNKFKSVKQLANAKKEHIEKCEGIGKVRAEQIVEFFKREYKDL